MPTEQNITSPAMLISLGRSGTSLLQAAFRHHPDFEVGGETASLILKTYLAASEALPHMPRREKLPIEEQSGRATRAVFLTLLPGDTPFWFHKPIGLQPLFGNLTMWKDSAAYMQLYWNAMQHTFPDARPFTILRHPYDVLLSHKHWFNQSDRTAWEYIWHMARILTHEQANIAHAVVYADLVAEPEATLRALFDHIQRPYHPACLKAFGKAYVQNRGKDGLKTLDQVPDKVATGFSRKESWQEIDTSVIRPEERATVDALWARFGKTIAW